MKKDDDDKNDPKKNRQLRAEDLGDMEEDSVGKGLGNSIEIFTKEERDELMSYIKAIPECYDDTVARERNYDKYRSILTVYQEKPSLVDPYLEDFLKPLIYIIRHAEGKVMLLNSAAKYLMVLMKVRGYKKLIKKLPHEASKQKHII